MANGGSITKDDIIGKGQILITASMDPAAKKAITDFLDSLNQIVKGDKLAQYFDTLENVSSKFAASFKRFQKEANETNARTLINDFNALQGIAASEGKDFTKYFSAISGGYDSVRRAIMDAQAVAKGSSFDGITMKSVKDFNDSAKVIREWGADVKSIIDEVSMNSSTEELRVRILELNEALAISNAEKARAIAANERYRKAAEEAAEAEGRLKDKLNGEEYKDLVARAEKYNDVVRKNVQEVERFVEVTRLASFDKYGFIQSSVGDGEIESILDSVRAGTMSAADAIVYLKQEYRDLIDMSSAQNLGEDRLRSLEATLRETVEALVEMRDAIGNGGYSSGVGTIIDRFLGDSSEIHGDADEVKNAQQVIAALFNTLTTGSGQVSADQSGITNFVAALRDLANVDLRNLETTAEILKRIPDTANFQIDLDQVSNLKRALSDLVQLSKDIDLTRLTSLTNIHLGGFSDLKIRKEGLSHLATYLPDICNNVDIEKLRAISEISFAGFDSKNFNVSKASFDHLKEVIDLLTGGAVTANANSKLQDTAAVQSAQKLTEETKKESAAFTEVNTAAKEHSQFIADAKQAEEQKLGIAEKLIDALKREEQAFRDAGTAAEQSSKSMQQQVEYAERYQQTADKLSTLMATGAKGLPASTGTSESLVTEDGRLIKLNDDWQVHAGYVKDAAQAEAEKASSSRDLSGAMEGEYTEVEKVNDVSEQHIGIIESGARALLDAAIVEEQSAKAAESETISTGKLNKALVDIAKNRQENANAGKYYAEILESTRAKTEDSNAALQGNMLLLEDSQAIHARYNQLLVESMKNKEEDTYATRVMQEAAAGMLKRHQEQADALTKENQLINENAEAARQDAEATAQNTQADQQAADATEHATSAEERNTSAIEKNNETKRQAATINQEFHDASLGTKEAVEEETASEDQYNQKLTEVANALKNVQTAKHNLANTPGGMMQAEYTELTELESKLQDLKDAGMATPFKELKSEIIELKKNMSDSLQTMNLFTMEQKDSAKAAKELAAAEKEVQQANYNSARKTVNRYWGLMTAKDTSSSKRGDLVQGANGWASQSGVYSNLAVQLNEATEKYNQLVGALNQYNVSAKQSAQITELCKEKEDAYVLAKESAIAKETEAAQKAEAAAQKKRDQAAASREAKAAKEEEADATRKQADADKESASAAKEADAARKQGEATLKKLNSLLVQCTNEEEKFKAAQNIGPLKDSYKELQNITNQVRALAEQFRNTKQPTQEMIDQANQLATAHSNVVTTLKTSGNAVSRWISSGTQMLASRLQYTFGLAALVFKTINEIKQMISTAVDLDSAMNTLQIVTKGSAADMDKYASSVTSMAKETAQATKDLIDATTVYARLGYSMDDSAVLSKYTAMLQGVGGIEAGAAQDAMTAIIKAFGKNVGDIEDVMDKLVNVGNNFPISVSQLAEGMNNAGSMLAVAGNSFEESVALLTAANTTIQNISKASTGLRTIAARIRKMKSEDGEIVEESKYNEMVDALTRHNVKLVDENGEYRKTYDIIKDIAAVWKDMNTMQQAAVVEALAGTRQQNIFASLMTQFGEAERAMESMGHATGELQESYDIYLNSIQAHVQTMKAAMDELSMDFINGDLAKNVIDILTKIIEGIDHLIDKIGVLGTAFAGIGSLGIIKTIATGSLATGFSLTAKVVGGLSSAIGAIITALPELLLVAATIAAIAAVYKEIRANNPTVGDLQSAAKDARSKAEAAEQAYKDMADQVDDNKKKIKELQDLVTNGEITRAQADELQNLRDQNEKYEEQLRILERKAEIAKEAAEYAKRESGRAQFNAMFGGSKYDDNVVIPFGGSSLLSRLWPNRFGSDNSSGGDSKMWMGAASVPKNENDKINELLGMYEYRAVEVEAVSRIIKERLESDSEDVRKSADGMIKDLEDSKSKLDETEEAIRQEYLALYDIREQLSDSNDPRDLAMVEQVDELLNLIDSKLPKTDRSLSSFKHNFDMLDSTIRDKLAKGLKLTKNEMRDFERWMNKCGYTAESLIKDLDDWSNELDNTPDGISDTAQKSIGDLTSLREELAATTKAIEDYNKAVEVKKGDAVEEMAKIYKEAMEDYKSGKIDSTVLHAASELFFSDEQLAAWGYDIRKVGEALNSEMMQYIFNPEGDSEYDYGQRFAEYVRSHFTSANGVWVENGNFFYNSLSDVARAFGMSEEACTAFLDSLDEYGINVMRSTEENNRLIAQYQGIKEAAEAIGGSGDAIGDFATTLATAGRDSMEIAAIIKDLRESGYLSASDAEIAEAITKAKEAVAKAAEEEEDINIINPENEKASIDAVRDYLTELFKNPTHTQVIIDLVDPNGNKVENLEDALPDWMNELGNAYNDLVNGNVDYNKRPFVSPAKMIEAGWKDFNGDIATTYSQRYQIGEGKYKMAVEVTPILDNGEVLSPEALDAYVMSLDASHGLTGVTNSDSHKLVIHVVPGETDTKEWDELEEKLSYIKELHTELAYHSGVIEPQADLNTEEFDNGAQDVSTWLNDLNQRVAQPGIDVNLNNFVSKLNSAVRMLNQLGNMSVSPTVNATVNTTVRSNNTTSTSGVRGTFASAGGKGYGYGGGKTLVNELGPELISDNGRAFIANSGRPGFIDLTSNAIVFTAEETYDILHGRKSVSSKSMAGGNIGRAGLIGRLLGAGTNARATYTKPVAVKPTPQAYCPYCGYTIQNNFTGNCPHCGKYINKGAKTAEWQCDYCGRWNPSTIAICNGCRRSKYGGQQQIQKTTTSTVANTVPTNAYAPQQYTNTPIFSYDGGSGGGSGGSGYNNEEEDKPQKFDWIEVRLSRIQQVIEDIDRVASSGFKRLNTRNDAAKSEIAKIREKITNSESGYTRYMSEAESVGLSSDLKQKVRSGAIDISEYDSDTQELISEYQEWYEKALECKSAIDELHLSIAQLYKDIFDNTQADFDNQLAEIEHAAAMTQKNMDMATAKGYIDSAKFYEQLSDTQTVNINKLKAELGELNDSFKEAMSSGEIEENSEEWYAMKQSINAVEEAIADANIKLVEYQKTIRQLNWDYFDYAQERFGKLNDEADFFIRLMSNHDLFKDNGQFNELGSATVGMHATRYNAFMAEADDYAKELAKIQRQLEQDPYDKELIARRETLLDLQHQSILAAEGEKDAIKDLVETGIDKELDSLKDLIDAYKDSIDSAKDLYEYQKKIADKTSDIASLEKQLAAYQGDNSEETRAKIQKLTKSLDDKRKDLEETERDQSISDQKKLLDDLYDDYEELLNQRLDNIDLLMQEMIIGTNENLASIRTTLVAVGDEVGYKMTEAMSQVLQGDLGYYDHGFDGETSVQNLLSSIYDMVAAMARASGAVKAYATGGLVDYTGLAAVHGSKSRPELMLNANDTENFLEAAKMMRDTLIAPVSAQTTSIGDGFGAGINNVTLGPIMIDHVQDYNDFVNQLRNDPKFERLINTMTLDRAVGKSTFRKNQIRF